MTEIDYQTVFDQTSRPVAVFTPQLKVAAVNNAYLRATHCTRERVVGKPVDQAFPDDVALATALARAATSGLAAREPCIVPVLDGAATVRYLLHELPAVSAVEALADPKIDFRRILETSQEGVWTIDAAGATTYANRQMAEMLGCDQTTMVGTPLQLFVFDEDLPKLDAAMERRRSGVVERHEFRFRRRDGSEFWANVSTDPILDEAGQFCGALAMVTDITVQRMMHSQLLVSDRMASMGSLAAGVAHEINNPLAALMGNLELASHALDDLQPAAPHVGELAAELAEAAIAAQQVLQISRDLRMFSRSGDDPLRPVNLHNVLESALRMARNEIRHRAQLVREYDEVPDVMANESRLGQVFLNLIVNAAQSIREGAADRNQIRLVTSLDDRGHVVTEIADTGSGMSPAVLRRLFTPFFTTKDASVGTGLGLAICHRIVASLGGELSVDSELGKGSRFRVRLPAASIDAARVIEAKPARVQSGRRGMILVVDDEPAVTRLLSRVLSPLHDVTVFNDAREALHAIERGARFEVVLCDLMMPVMTGMELHAVLHQLDPWQADQMIFLTGGAFTAPAIEFIRSVTNLQLDKPFEIRALLGVIATHLQLATRREPASPITSFASY